MEFPENLKRDCLFKRKDFMGFFTRRLVWKSNRHNNREPLVRVMGAWSATSPTSELQCRAFVSDAGSRRFEKRENIGRTEWDHNLADSKALLTYYMKASWLFS